MTNSKITIERSTESGYIKEELNINDAVISLNNLIENNQQIWIDGKPFMNNVIVESDIINCTQEICVTNKLTGG